MNGRTNERANSAHVLTQASKPEAALALARRLRRARHENYFNRRRLLLPFAASKSLEISKCSSRSPVGCRGSMCYMHSRKALDLFLPPALDLLASLNPPLLLSFFFFFSSEGEAKGREGGREGRKGESFFAGSLTTVTRIKMNKLKCCIERAGSVGLHVCFFALLVSLAAPATLKSWAEPGAQQLKEAKFSAE